MSRSKLSNNSRREVGVGSSGIVYDLRQIEGGKKVSEVCREMGVSPEAVYRWKRRYWGLGLNEVRELRQAGRESQAEGDRSGPHVGQTHPARGAPKKGLKPAKRRELVREIRQAYRLNEVRACGLMRITR